VHYKFHDDDDAPLQPMCCLFLLSLTILTVSCYKLLTDGWMVL